MSTLKPVIDGYCDRNKIHSVNFLSEPCQEYSSVVLSLWGHEAMLLAGYGEMGTVISARNQGTASQTLLPASLM